MVMDNQIFEFRWHWDNAKNTRLNAITIEDIWEIALQVYAIRHNPEIWVTVYFVVPTAQEQTGQSYNDKIHIAHDFCDVDSITEGTKELLWHYVHLIQTTAKTIGKMSTMMNLTSR